METPPGPSNSRKSPSSNTPSKQQQGSIKFRTWEPSQQKRSNENQPQENQHSPQKQSQEEKYSRQQSKLEASHPQHSQHKSYGSHSNGVKHGSGHSTGVGDINKEILLEEVRKQRRRLEQLEAYALEAEEKYLALASLKETESQKKLREYKQNMERKFAEHDKQVRALHDKAAAREQEAIEIAEKMELALTDLFVAREAVLKEAVEVTPTIGMMLDAKEYKSKSEAKLDEVYALQKQFNELQEYIQQNPRKKSDLISSLKSSLQVDQTLTGLVITEHETKDGVDIVHCSQTGKLGNIQYRLEFFTDNDNTQQVHYIPLAIDFTDERLTTSMNDELQFDLADTSVFFWRMMTYLNKPPKQKRKV